MSGWHRAIAYALTGVDLDLGDQASPELDRLVRDLADHGWDADRLGDHARAVAGVEPWPHPLPDDLRAGLGVAQLYAAIGGARAHYGLEALTVLPPSRRTRLDADERRLMADVPPHFGQA